MNSEEKLNHQAAYEWATQESGTLSPDEMRKLDQEYALSVARQALLDCRREATVDGVVDTKLYLKLRLQYWRTRSAHE